MESSSRHKTFCRAALSAVLSLSFIATAQAPRHYQPTIESLDQHPLPQWFDDAKLGIFIHWGLYSVPGWAPLEQVNFSKPDFLKNNPYAEWYYNTVRIPGSPTQAYDRQHFGANHNYYDFAETFNAESKKWNPDVWAKTFKDAGAKYVVLTTKHHEGFTLWPSAIPNPTLPAARQHATRDLVGDLTTSVRNAGMKMGLYYSGGFDWTFVPGPIATHADFDPAKPQTEAYGKYVDAQYRELIQRYHPSVLWNDIDYPKSGHPLELEAEYYNAIPDGVVDNRFGIKHTDYDTPEYSTLKDINPKKWEECRGLGQSFGYNRAEGEAETIAADKLIYLLVDIVSKNGNLLLDVGPEADGTIPAVQLSRLKALGTWLNQNGEAIYGTHPWTHAEGKTADGIDIRFTQKNQTLYATLMGNLKGSSVTITALKLKPGTKVQLLGTKQPVTWSQEGADVKLNLPSTLPGKYAYVLGIGKSGIM
ncbi:alpha-L-fucosidase [Granulicella tundricola]|uniref:alpha-L-fucosidase n=1 Tax=Granulicella tundricola (strain ATCC BAA-1859 / DSM 23138 / MP5ACTX9) TaxID=1198114 RepID=E8X354_GRATM|nr:alpha-L-fucosidase [Granulicella tundricola]ADW69278.1 glycoside hydrolase family 29 (alpha-L-fucosidase) [Granulicella tundricola MP5ACTX9]